MEYYLANKNRVDPDICDKADKPEGQYIQRSKPETNQYISAFIHMQILKQWWALNMQAFVKMYLGPVRTVPED